MFCSQESSDILNNSDHTDSADISSEENIMSLNKTTAHSSCRNLAETILCDINTDAGELSSAGYLQLKSPTSLNHSPERVHSRSVSVDKNDAASSWSGYNVVAQSDDQTDEMYADSRQRQSMHSKQSWPSLQIVCPDPHQYCQSQGFEQDPHLYQSPMQHIPPSSNGTPSYYNPSPSRDHRDNRGLQPKGMDPLFMGPNMTYYPVTPMNSEQSLGGYPKMGSSFGASYSPQFRDNNYSSGSNPYNNSMYSTPMSNRGNRGMQIGGMGGPMMSPSAARSPAVNRRFMDPVDGYIYQVQFKRAHKNFILAPSAPRNISPGDFVKVEADRGEDMGIVLAKSIATDFEEVIPTAGYRGRGYSSGQGERKFLFRLANNEERTALVDKVQDEERALEVIRTKVLEQRLPMTILDAEYQFDRHKLTFFFEADRRIDFRELVSELFSLYKTRIWMQQVDTTGVGANDAGVELAKATGFLPKRDDKAYLAASQLHRSECNASGSAYTPTSYHQQPYLSQYTTAPNKNISPSYSVVPPLMSEMGSMGVGLGVETELAEGLGLSRSKSDDPMDTVCWQSPDAMHVGHMRGVTITMPFTPRSSRDVWDNSQSDFSEITLPSSRHHLQQESRQYGDSRTTMTALPFSSSLYGAPSSQHQQQQQSIARVETDDLYDREIRPTVKKNGILLNANATPWPPANSDTQQILRSNHSGLSPSALSPHSSSIGMAEPTPQEKDAVHDVIDDVATLLDQHFDI